MSAKTFLSTLGADAKKVFSWIGSSKGQSVITAGEAVAEAVADGVDPGLAALNPLIASWTQEVFKVESLSASAGAQSGTGVQKAAAVTSTLTPAVVAFAQQNGLAAPTAAEINAATTALVTFLNAFAAK
jgi:hypothetical protein